MNTQQKTKIDAPANQQVINIKREFAIPLELLYKAYTEASLIEKWMGTQVVEFNLNARGSYRFETLDPQGNIHGFSGCIHSFTPLKSLIRTFEMEGTDFPVQLEFLEFESLDSQKSKLEIKIVFNTIDVRNRLLKLPFSFGLNMAHNRIEELFTSNNL